MKRTNINTEESNENKRITKNVSALLSRVDAFMSSSQNCLAIFCHQAVSERMKLRDACEKVILLKHSNLIQKMEEIIWRKVYYEPLATSKKLRKESSWTNSEHALIWTHLNDGIAFYHQYLINVVVAHGGNTSHFADFMPTYMIEEKSHLVDQPQHFIDTFFRSLTCLGDLARYMLDLQGQGQNAMFSTSLISVRYYQQALHYNPEGGLTHSNLASVYLTNGNHLMAAIHYLRAITCAKPFMAAETNLKRLLDKSRSWISGEKARKDSSNEVVSLERKSTAFLHSCFSLLSCFMSERKTEEVTMLCQEVLLQMGKLLDDYDNVEPPDCSESSSEHSGHVKSKPMNGFVDFSFPGNPKAQFGSKVENSDYIFLLTPETMVVNCSLFIICAKHLSEKESLHCNMSQVLLVSILLTLVSHINTRLEQHFALIDPSFIQKLVPIEKNDIKTDHKPETEKEENKEPLVVNGTTTKSKKKGLSKLRRRIRGQCSEDDSEEGSDLDCMSEGSNCEDEDVNGSALFSSENEDSDEDIKIEDCREEEVRGMSAEEHLQLVEEEEMLAGVHILLHWLHFNEDLVKMCGKAADSLWLSLAKLFNLSNVNIDSIDFKNVSLARKDLLNSWKETRMSSGDTKNSSSSQCFILPESVKLMTILPEFHVSEWSSESKNMDQMNLLRVLELRKLILSLTELSDVPLAFNEEGKLVKCEQKVKEWKSSKNGYDQTSDAFTSQRQKNMISDKASMKGESPSAQNNHSTLTQPNSTDKAKINSMQNLTAQWLQHEVKSLERKIKPYKGGPCGLYLVPDASVLVHCLPVVKSILASPTFVIIIPQTVIDSLDYQKKDSVGARDAIRWLESKLRHGSRFMRTQRSHERKHISFIKYPKKKEKEAWEWIHLAECSHYMSAQMSKSDLKTSTVSILTTDTSIKVPKTTLSLKTLAEAADCALISVEDLVSKWQKKSSSSKAPG